MNQFTAEDDRAFLAYVRGLHAEVAPAGRKRTAERIRLNDLALTLETVAAALERAWRERDESRRQVEQLEAEHAADLATLAPDAGQVLDPRGFFVYLLLEAGSVIYVGQSVNVLARLGNHMATDDRRHRVDRVRVIRCESMGAMRRLERTLIEQLSPELNIVMNPRPRHRRRRPVPHNLPHTAAPSPRQVPAGQQIRVGDTGIEPVTPAV